MKKIIAIAVAVATVLLLSVLAVSAGYEDGYEYRIGDTTVIFDADTELTEEQRQSIVDAVAAERDPYAAEPANLICSIFGHKYSDEGYNMIFIIHEVREEDPRCDEQIRQIRTCSRCDKLTTTIIKSKSISCCP